MEQEIVQQAHLLLYTSVTSTFAVIFHVRHRQNRSP